MDLPQSKDKQRLLSQWDNTYLGPKWAENIHKFKKIESSNNSLREIDIQIDTLQQPPSELKWRHVFLERTGYIRDGHLSILGTLAAEIYEGHPLLMSYAFTKKLFHHLTAEEIVSYLSVFLDVSGFEGVSYYIPIQSPVYALQQYALQLSQYEVIQESEQYWKVSLFWRDLVTDWLDGDSSKNICEIYDVDEGTLVKNILKLNNLVEEWRNLAIIIEDLDMLDKLRNINLIREIAIPDSLYLV